MDRNRKMIEMAQKGMTQIEIAKEIGIAQSSVSRVLKGKSINVRQWTKEEEEYIKDNYGLVSFKGIAKKLGRTVSGVKTKIRRLGLGRASEYTGFLTLKDIENAFKKDRGTIKSVWVDKKGLKASYRVLSNKRKFYQVSIEELWKWAREHTELIDFSKLEEGALGAEPKWVVEERKKDFKKIDKKSHQFWTNDEDKLLQMYWYAGKTSKEIAKLMNRTHTAIESRAYKIELKRKVVPLKWTQKEIDMLIDLKLKGNTDKEIAKELGRGFETVKWKRTELIKRGLLKWEYRPINRNI